MGAQQGRGSRVQLAFHQSLGLLCEHHLGAPGGECAGRRDPEETAADHHGAQAGAYGRGKGQAVVHGAERVHALGQFPAVRLEQAAQRRKDRVRAGGQDEGVVPEHRPVVAVHRPVGAVDADRAHAPAQRRARVREPDHLGGVPVEPRISASSTRLYGTCGSSPSTVTAAAPPHGQPRRAPQAYQAAADHHHTPIRSHGTSVRGRCFPAASPLLPGRNAHLSTEPGGP